MIKLNILRAPLCAAALLLYIGAEAQWPQRLDFAGLDDEASATAVDRWGNVFVAGTVTTTGDGKDFYVASYTASGVMRTGWPRRYDGPAAGNGSDDIATSIHVDPASGNVYVGGTSYGGSSGFDFCVIAYDSGGNPIWPVSGGGTGYAYHNGALRTTSTLDEGARSGSPGTATLVHVSMAVREDYLDENRVIAMTGIVAPDNDTDYWRTVVFEPGPAFPYNPALKSGWPVDLDDVTDHDEIPEAVAIHTDNSVYVTGTTSPESGVQDFTTIRYKPTGGNLSPEYWRHDWNPPPANKSHSGKDIVLDRNGDAYATGYVTHDGFDYGTVAIRKDADAGGNPQVKWDHIWEPEPISNESATSISLTYEVENGALLPFVYVTGTVETTGKIATLRYRSDYTVPPMDPEWARLHTPTAGAAFGLDVIGAGYGNAYVVGRSNDDLVVIGYRRDGSERLGPLFYHLVDFDEGRMGAMVGAGALVATGASDGTGTSADFVTQRFFQTTGASSPSSYIVRMGLYFSGGLSDLTASDNSYMVFRDNPASDSNPPIRVEFTGSTTVGNPTEICVNFEGKSNARSSQEIEAYDWLTSSWVMLDKRLSTSVDSRLTLVIKDDPGRYLSAGAYKVRVSYRNQAADVLIWKVSFDQLTVDVLGG